MVYVIQVCWQLASRIRMEGISILNMLYPALLPLMRTPRLPLVDWTDAPTDLNGLVRFAERRNLFSMRVSSHFRRSLLWTHLTPQLNYLGRLKTYRPWSLRLPGSVCVYTLKKKKYQNYVWRFSSYRAVSTIRLSHRNHQLMLCREMLFWQPYETPKYTLWAERRIFDRETRWYTYVKLPLGFKGWIKFANFPVTLPHATCLGLLKPLMQ